MGIVTGSPYVPAREVPAATDSGDSLENRSAVAEIIDFLDHIPTKEDDALQLLGNIKYRWNGSNFFDKRIVFDSNNSAADMLWMSNNRRSVLVKHIHYLSHMQGNEAPLGTG